MRVALYARVSTEEQALHGLSIEAQLAALREAFPNGKEYVDLGISARSPIKKRPELQRLLRDIESDKFDLVAFVKLDRWTRNIREYYKAQDILDAHNVAWKALHEDYETQTAAGRLKVNIMLAVAQDEADRTSERVKMVFEEKRRKGLITNGRVPPGFVCKNGVVSVGDLTGVKELFREYVSTRNVNHVARLTPVLLGRQYSVRGTRDVLCNERYKEIIPEWQTAQNILSTHQQRTRTDRVYLFSGLLYCPECGKKLTVHTRNWKGVFYTYYRCDNHDRLRTCSWAGSVRETECEDFMVKRIVHTITDQNLRLSKGKRKTVDVPALKRKLDRLTDLYVDEKITKEDYDRRSAPLRESIEAAQIVQKPVDESVMLSALEIYPVLSTESKKALWSGVVKRITPKGDGSFDIILL